MSTKTISVSLAAACCFTFIALGVEASHAASHAGVPVIANVGHATVAGKAAKPKPGFSGVGSNPAQQGFSNGQGSNNTPQGFANGKGSNNTPQGFANGQGSNNTSQGFANGQGSNNPAPAGYKLGTPPVSGYSTGY